MRDLVVCARKVCGALVMLNLSTDNELLCTKSYIMGSKVIYHLNRFMLLTQKEDEKLKCLNFRIIQSKNHTSINQTYYVMNMTDFHFNKVKHLSTDNLFRNDHKVDSKIANTTPNAPEIQFMLYDKHCDSSSKFGDALHAMVWTKLDRGFSIKGLGCFQTVLCELGYFLMHKLMCYLNTHP